MEDSGRSYNPHLQRVLKSYQSSALRTLKGPASCFSGGGGGPVATLEGVTGGTVSMVNSPAIAAALVGLPVTAGSIWAAGAAGGTQGMTLSREHGLNLHTNNVVHPAILQKMSADRMEEYTKSLVNVKKSSRAVAIDSMGLRDSDGHYYRTVLPGPPFPIKPAPFFTPLDSSRSEKMETRLEDEMIACFVVGGEKRLCLPQILNTVLRNYSLQQINQVCDELHIFCSRCNPDQLDLLKVSAILPMSAPSCGLITKTDAERLCNALLYPSPEKLKDPPPANCFKVYHECFGKCKGIFIPEMYTNNDAKCIECVDCRGLFCTAKFVCHSHKALENRTCHWGFDSANWRSYLLLAKDQDGKDKLQDILEQIKGRFDMTKHKRRQSPGLDNNSLKRSKYEDGRSSTPVSSGEQNVSWRELSPGSSTVYGRPMSAFRPWSPSLVAAIKEGKIIPTPSALMRDGYPQLLPSYLQRGPPVLLNPERVVPLSETDRYERHFAPNVSLAPLPCQKVKQEPFDNDPVKPINLGKNIDPYDGDTSTDTDESRLSSPIDPAMNGNRSGSPNPDSTLERELELVRDALEKSTIEEREQRNKLFQEFSRLRARHEEQWNRGIKSKHKAMKEIQQLKVSLQESNDMRRSLQAELDRVRAESDCRLQDAQEARDRLASEVETMKKAQDTKIVKSTNGLSSENHELHMRLKHMDKICEQLRGENQWLRDELCRHGITLNSMAAAMVAKTPPNELLHIANGKVGKDEAGLLLSPGGKERPSPPHHQHHSKQQQQQQNSYSPRGSNSSSPPEHSPPHRHHHHHHHHHHHLKSPSNSLPFSPVKSEIL